MKKARYLVLALVLVALVATTGCFGNVADKVEGYWVSATSFATTNYAVPSDVTMNLVGGQGFHFMIYCYLYNSQITWNGFTWNIVTDAGAAERYSKFSKEDLKALVRSGGVRAVEDSTLALWCGAGDANFLIVWVLSDRDGDDTQEYMDYFFIGSLVDNQLECVYLVLDNEIVVDADSAELPTLEYFNAGI